MLNKYLTNRQLISIFTIEKVAFLLHPTLISYPKADMKQQTKGEGDGRELEAYSGEKPYAITNVIQKCMVIRRCKQIFSWFYYGFSIPYRQYASLQPTPAADHTPAPPSPYSAAGIQENRHDMHIGAPRKQTLCVHLYTNEYACKHEKMVKLVQGLELHVHK